MLHYAVSMYNMLVSGDKESLPSVYSSENIENSKKILEFILEKTHRLLDARGRDGNTALHLAAFGKDASVVSLLQKAGARDDIPNYKGETVAYLINKNITIKPTHS